ncbi:MAG: phosphoribosyl-AMP cyclohydrolase [Candidatus Omnitrophica bacterium 4484_70.2]|nr:MAG: phosphoribosyl-AMP cyclohydrolase [Candidatus Omnitrophica bacterium 4484_70.2]
MRLPKLKFNEKGLIPVIVQDEKTKKVLMLAYMNKESLKITLKEKRTCFWSRSRKTLWRKGETSGNIQKVKKIFYDCDKDTLLIIVEQVGVACHTGNFTCFFERLI